MLTGAGTASLLPPPAFSLGNQVYSACVKVLQPSADRANAHTPTVLPPTVCTSVQFAALPSDAYSKPGGRAASSTDSNVHWLHADTMIHSAALLSGAYSKPGGRNTSARDFNVQQTQVDTRIKPAALPPGTYSMPVVRVTSSTDFNVQRPQIESKVHSAALPSGAYSKPGGGAISSIDFNVQYQQIETKIQPAALPPGAYSKPGGRAISSTRADYNSLWSSTICEVLLLSLHVCYMQSPALFVYNLVCTTCHTKLCVNTALAQRICHAYCTLHYGCRCCCDSLQNMYFTRGQTALTKTNNVTYTGNDTTNVIPSHSIKPHPTALPSHTAHHHWLGDCPTSSMMDVVLLLHASTDVVNLTAGEFGL